MRSPKIQLYCYLKKYIKNWYNSKESLDKKSRKLFMRKKCNMIMNTNYIISINQKTQITNIEYRFRALSQQNNIEIAMLLTDSFEPNWPQVKASLRYFLLDHITINIRKYDVDKFRNKWIKMSFIHNQLIKNKLKIYMTLASTFQDLESEVNLEEPPQPNHNWAIFLQQLNQQSYYCKNRAEKSQNRSIRRESQVGKIINYKMRNRLMRWLQQICFETFNFSISTFVNSIQILDEYLSKTNQHFSQLQLIGCASIYLSSKIYQKTIIGAQSYCSCSDNIFSQKQLQQKEKLIFSTLNFNLNFSNPIKLLRYFNKTVNLPINKIQQAESFLIETFFDESYFGLSQFQIAISIVYLLNSKQELSKEGILRNLKREYY